MKRVWCLYRVSTKHQLNLDEDIPMQRNACIEFISRHKDWHITKELVERGISGWKTKTEERDALNEIKLGALNNQLDILLVFMFDRIGRREDETPLVVDFLHKNGVEVWSVNEGKKNMESHVDKLINYINFWQSSGESLKTSIRVRESKKQLSKQGYFQGGIAPYGYEIYETELPHWKEPNRKLKELRPNEYEKRVVKLIYDLYVNRNYGIRKITGYLNENSYRTRFEKEFGVSLVTRILSNPIYIGYRRYKNEDDATETQPFNELLQLIPNELFEQAKRIRQVRKQEFNSQDKSNITINGKLLFSGLTYCQYCGSKLTANYLYRKNVNKQGESYKTVIYRYSCPMNNGNKKGHEQYVWGAVKYDKVIIKEVKKIIELLDIKLLIDPSKRIKEDILQLKITELQVLKKLNTSLQNKRNSLNKEIAICLLGESKFTPAQISEALELVENEIGQTINKIHKTKEQIECIKTEAMNFMKFNKEGLENWEQVFDNADHDLKKALFRNIIESVHLGKDKVTIKFKVFFEELFNQINIEKNNSM
jgi:site-specific DNA recombinase